jgi:putative ABC transport system permease protein
LRAIERGQKVAIERIQAAFPGLAPRELLARMPPGLGDALSGAGYRMDSSRLGELRRFAERTDDLKTINRLLLGAEASAAVAREMRVELSQVSFDGVAEYVDSARRARWLGGVLGAAGAPPRLGPERLTELVDGYRREKKLGRAVGAEVPSESGGLFGLSERNRWLIALSFLVCVVGVANAMLMSVTERFTEIATMKCLGAMDRFVMMMFVFEAVIQGAAGGLAGLLLGGLLALMRALFDYGSLIGNASGAVGPVGLAMLGSLLVGIILAAIAAVGPAWIASRLAPMEAMRVE